jgi:hypothetical protein
MVSIVSAAAFCLAAGAATLQAQTGEEAIHKRGRLWETVRNDGWIGSLGAWDFLTSAPLGLYPGFDGYTHPIGSEFNAYPGVYVNANYHNFRSGVWIVAKDLQTPGPPPGYTPIQTDYELYFAGMQADAFGVASVRDPIVLTKNYQGTAGFVPGLPEEMTAARWHTNTGITVTRRSSVWSTPGYADFIIYDYVFTNTGTMVSTQTSQVVPFPTQRLPTIYFVFHSGIAVSTKSQICFHDNLDGVAAGGFGYVKETFHDVYHQEDSGTLVYSTNVNGGAAPPAWDGTQKKPNEGWKRIFGNELLSPAAFGWLALSAPPATAPVHPRARPEAPDVLRIDSHKGGDFPPGEPLDLERFVPSNKPKKLFYQFVTTPDSTGGGKLPNIGNRENFYTMSYGPYALNVGDSLRFVVAEIAGVMDYHDVTAGGNGHFPDSTIAAIRRNAANARNAVRWGLGAVVNGVPLAADVPEPPPAPATDAVNASLGTDTAAIAVTWDRTAETAIIADGIGGPFYRGAPDLQGYRIYRSTDFQYTSQTQTPVLRGESWDLLADIPAAAFPTYFDAGIGKYRFLDRAVNFGFKYGYYVQAYWTPSTWTSANGTVVTGLPELASGPVNKTLPTAAAPGPVTTFDVFVAPNPFIYGDLQRSFAQNGNLYGIEFRNLPESCTIRIYTLTGDLVRTLEHRRDARGSVFGSEAWDQKTDSGLLVAPGLYVYHVQSTTAGLDRSATGKLMIIR